VVGGQYKALQRPSRLVYSWQWEGEKSPMPHVETLVEVTLSEKDGGTELHMTHSGFPAAAARDGHHHGWSSAFNRLNDLLDPRGSAGTLTLLGDARSTYTRTARMALAEKGVAYTMQNCGPHSPEILAVHPFGRIPALRDGEIDIWETAAILNYLDECFDSGVSLRPGSIMERTRCAQWISAVNSYLYDTMVRRYVLQIIFPKGEGGQPDRRIVDAALAEMPTQLAALDKAYGPSDYLAGASLSSADLFLAPILAYVQNMPEGGQLMAHYPNLLRAQNLIRQRASFTSTHPQ
jgi:glutathione S-transferase